MKAMTNGQNGQLTDLSPRKSDHLKRMKDTIKEIHIAFTWKQKKR